MFFITFLLYYSGQKGNIREKITILEHTFRKKSYTMPYSVKPVNFRKNNHRPFFVQNLILYKKYFLHIFSKIVRNWDNCKCKLWITIGYQNKKNFFKNEKPIIISRMLESRHLKDKLKIKN